MSSLEGFDASQVEPEQGRDALPAGEYRVCIVGSEMKPTKAGNGQLLNLQLQVLDGQYQNRRIFDRINYVNPSAPAQQIGRARLSSICRAVGVMTPKDTGELHNIPLRVKVKIRKDEGYGEQNEISKYSPDKAGTDVPQQQQTPGSAAVWAQNVGG